MVAEAGLPCVTRIAPREEEASPFFAPKKVDGVCNAFAVNRSTNAKRRLLDSREVPR